MEVDRNGLQVLYRHTCIELLAQATLGRVALSVGALPVVLPVNYRYVDGRIVFRTSPGTKLDAATRDAVVAFEVDHVDPMYHTGWSVLVQGTAREITDRDELARARASHIARWAPGGDDRYVAISMELVSGRRLIEGSPDRHAPLEHGPAAVAGS